MENSQDKNKLNDGGYAFATFKGNDYEAQRGMTLRDYFAAKAITGVMGEWGTDAGSGGSQGFYPDQIAKKVYAIADAMIAERQKGGTNHV